MGTMKTVETVVNTRERAGEKSPGKIYSDKLKVRRRREWRGVKDTLFDYSRWCYLMFGVLGKFILNPRNELLVVRRGKEPAKGTLDLVGGFVDMYETVEEGMRREIKEETGLKVDDIQYLFSSPNVYMYSGMGVHTLDMDFLVRVHGDSVAVKAADDAAEAIWIPINKVNPAEFGLTSIRNAVIRFLTETLRK
jgi:ADP-ribose pyrophosphatase YjhB (NUDIX family)